MDLFIQQQQLTLPVSITVKFKNELVIVRFTFSPAFSSIGVSLSILNRLSIFFFLSPVFRPADSQTRFIHSLAICDLVSKSRTFIDVNISKQPTYLAVDERKRSGERFSWLSDISPEQQQQTHVQSLDSPI